MSSRAVGSSSARHAAVATFGLDASAFIYPPVRSPESRSLRTILGTMPLPHSTDYMSIPVSGSVHISVPALCGVPPAQSTCVSVRVRADYLGHTLVGALQRCAPRTTGTASRADFVMAENRKLSLMLRRASSLSAPDPHTRVHTNFTRRTLAVRNAISGYVSMYARSVLVLSDTL